MSKKIKKLASTIVCGALAFALLQTIGCTAPGKLDSQSIDPTVPGKIAISEQPTALGDAGRVLAHEDGPFNFIPFKYCQRINPCPAQLRAMLAENEQRPLAQQIHFVKISIRTLNDGTWVVAHDQVQYIVTSTSAASRAEEIGAGVQLLHELPAGKKLFSFEQDGKTHYGVTDGRSVEYFRRNHAAAEVKSIPRDKNIISVDLSAIDSSQLADLEKTYGDLVDVYRLEDFTKNGLAPNFSYMLYFKTDPNQNIINEIDRLGINNRTVLESRSNDDADWVHNHQGQKSGIFFTGRVGSPGELDDLLKIAPTYGNKMWAIEVDKNDDTVQIVKTVNATQYISHVDSMLYDLLKESLITACDKPLLDVGSNTTMTSRPMDCLDKMKTGNSSR
jgi:hypothetical protein